MSAATRFPLTWPAGWKRTTERGRKAGKFRMPAAGAAFATGPNSAREQPISIAHAIARVLTELKRLGVPESSVIVSSNLKVGRAGWPLSDQRNPDDPGVAVYWNDASTNSLAKAIACDLYDRAADNLAAIAATLEAMRAIERHGGAQILNRVFTGFDALPAPKNCWKILHILPTRDRDTIERAYRVRARICHPDAGGTAAAFAELTNARDRALEGL